MVIPAAIQLPRPTILDWLDCKEHDQLLSDSTPRMQAGSKGELGSSDFTPSALYALNKWAGAEGESHEGAQHEIERRRASR